MAAHVFQPTHYHTTLGPHEPVLTIADGDMVETTTVDAAGYDAAGVQAAPRGNADGTVLRRGS
jgi:amidase